MKMVYRYDHHFEDIENNENVYQEGVMWRKIDKRKNIVGLKAVSPKSFIVQEHFHDWIEFIFIEEGKQDFMINEEVFHLSKGDFFMIPYNLMHKSETFDEETKKIVLQIKRSYLNEIIPLFDADRIICNTMYITTAQEYHLYHELIEQFKIMMTLYFEEDEKSRVGFQGSLYMFFYLLMKNFEGNQNDHAVYQKTGEYINQILNYMHKHYDEDISLDILADYLHITPKYISRIVKENIGINFKDYLNQIRLNHAVYEMANSHQSLSEIAYCCGFSNYKSMIKIFQQTYHMTPLAYRKQQKS